MKKFVFCFLICFFSVTVCSAEEKTIRFLDETHSLNNKIWDVSAQAFVSSNDVSQALLQSDIVILGESHDNPRHHELQNWALTTLLKAKREPAVSFEMIDQEQYEKLDLSKISSADALFDALNWEKTGWPNRKLYHALFETVVSANLPIASANLARKTLHKVISQASPPSDEVKQLLDAKPLTETERTSMLKELEESHCHMLPKQHVSGMITGQRVRDAVMALSLLKHSHADPAVLIAGKAHGRLDRGAPAFVRLRKPEAKIISIGWHEVQTDRPQPADYRKIWQSETLPFDYVWFTARVDRPDPCDEIKAFLNKKSKKETQNDSDKKED